MSAFSLLAERQLLQSRGVRWSATLSLQQCVLAFHTGETPLFEVNSKQNDSFVLFLNYMQMSKTVIIKKCSTPANFLFYYLNGIPITSSSSIIEQPFFHIEEKCSSNQRRPKTKKHAFLRATSMEIVIFMSVWDCKGFFCYENEKSPWKSRTFSGGEGEIWTLAPV